MRFELSLAFMLICFFSAVNAEVITVEAPVSNQSTLIFEGHVQRSNPE